MSNDFAAAGIRTGHNMHVLNSVVDDIVDGFKQNLHERRHISLSQDDIERAAGKLLGVLTEIYRGDTSQRRTRVKPQEILSAHDHLVGALRLVHDSEGE